MSSDSDHDQPVEGSVKWFDLKKGYGFIVGPQDQDVFVHFSSIQSDGFRTLRDGEPVAYELCQGEKGYHARNVRRLGTADLPSPRAQAVGRDGSGRNGNFRGDGRAFTRPSGRNARPRPAKKPAFTDAPPLHAYAPPSA